MKIAVVVGHNARAQGAVRRIDGVSEFKWNTHLAQLIRELDPDCVRVFYRTTGGYTAEVKRAYAEVDNWGADVSIELHFNGSPSPTATGCLTLSSGTAGSMVLAEEVHSQMLAVMENEDDGIEVRGRGARGGLSLWSGACPAIIAEPYFGGNDRFATVADARKDQLAEAIYQGAVAAVRRLAA